MCVENTCACVCVMLAEAFFSRQQWGPAQSFYMGDLEGDGHVDRERTYFSRTAQSSDVGFLMQFLIDLQALCHRYGWVSG